MAENILRRIIEIVFTIIGQGGFFWITSISPLLLIHWVESRKSVRERNERWLGIVIVCAFVGIISIMINGTVEFYKNGSYFIPAVWGTYNEYSKIAKTGIALSLISAFIITIKLFLLFDKHGLLIKEYRLLSEKNEHLEMVVKEKDDILELVALDNRRELYEGGGGETIEDAVEVNTYTDRMKVLAEYYYIEKRYGRKNIDWDLKKQDIVYGPDSKTSYDLLTIYLTKDGTSIDFYFLD
jgi:hypothetical protein